MMDVPRIRQVSEQIARRFRPERIILFGSYAYGVPAPHSDVDLLVVMPFQGRERAQARAIKQAVAADSPVYLDLLVYDPQDLRRRPDWGDWFLREVTQKGTVLYDAAHAGVGHQGGGRLGGTGAGTAGAQSPELR